MTLTGEFFIGDCTMRSSTTFRALGAASGNALEPPFYVADTGAVNRACEVAWADFPRYRDIGIVQRARFLDAIADQLMLLGDELIDRAVAESGLPAARLTGERGRTASQLRLFADGLRRGGWARVRVDPAQPARRPLARPEMRQYQVALGPVAVFGASNFPLAFSVAGGDTAAALAAGCPVIVKGHPAHPGTSELVARAVVAAARSSGIPAGVFALLNSPSHELGAELVRHPSIKAVGFTGSRAGGLALMKIAAAREEPIPVFAEMSSVNPVILLPDALESGAEALATRFVESLTLGTGQFCTNPGLVVAVKHPSLRRFVTQVADMLRNLPAGVMLTPAIAQAYAAGVRRQQQDPNVRVLAQGLEGNSSTTGRPALFSADAGAVLQHPEISQEVFGPASVVVSCENASELRHVVQHMEGQLTASLHFTERDSQLAHELTGLLEGKVGRLIANGWPTGVEVAHAMVHGGPYPATSDGRSTSVGTLAVERFMRPVCYQDFPQALLPEALQDQVFTLYPHCYDGEFRAGSGAPGAKP